MGAQAARFQAAEEAEQHYRRMRRLLQMDGADLKALLSGHARDVAPWIESAARYGVVEAQLCLGQMRLDGLGARRDPASALGWFLRAARKGSPEAMNMAGRCHENGWGAPVDLEQAAHWYRRSAEAGHDWGEYNYANLLFDGRGVGCDQAEAVAWYRRAAGQGHARAMNLLARCLEEGWGAAKDPAEARAWYRRSAEGGYFRAQYNHASLLAAEGLIPDALAWFERSCRDASEDSRPAMVRGLAAHPNPPVAELGRRLATEFGVGS
jgi:hypothetical protein